MGGIMRKESEERKDSRREEASEARGRESCQQAKTKLQVGR